ncbi:MAG TPA: PA2778 family cysteine peptidase [Steroidobacteraceae bacterium]
MIGPAARLCLAALLLGLAACSRQLLHDSGVTRPRVEISRTPFFPQSEHHCGPAALATILVAAGADATPESLTKEVYLPGRKGSLQAELLASTRRHLRVAYVIDPTLQDLLAELEREQPVLVLQNFGLPFLPLWHYAVVIGYDRERETFLLRSGRHAHQEIAAVRFLGTWGRAGNWGFIALQPGGLPAGATAARFLEAVDALDTQGDHQAAAPSYELAVQRWPAEPLAWFALGNSRSALGQGSAAEAAYREVLRMAPADLPARNNLALLMARRGCRTEALAMLQSARTAAANGPLAAEIADSLREIQALATPATPAASCP